MELFGTKVCPQCGQELFDDMDVCYGCLYSFEERPEQSEHALPELPDLDEPDIEPEVPSEVRGALSLKISTDDAQATMPIPQAGIVIGRDPLCDVVLRSRAVSLRHARVIPLSSAVIVEDLGSTNPVVYKGREVVETAVVHIGESFEICGATFTVVT